MVALQFLVLSVVVRVRLGQHGKRTVIRPYAFFRTGIDAYHTGTRGSRNSEHTYYYTAKEPLLSGSFYLTMMKVSPSVSENKSFSAGKKIFQCREKNLSVPENKSFSGTKSIFQCRYINHFMPAFPPYCVNVYTLLYICVCSSMTSYAPSHCGLCALRRTGNHFTVMR